MVDAAVEAAAETIGICGSSSNSIVAAAPISEEADAYTGRPGTIVPMVGGALIVASRHQVASIAIREIVGNHLCRVRDSRDSASSSLQDVDSSVVIRRKETLRAGISIMLNSVKRWAAVDPCEITSRSNSVWLAPALAA